VRVAVGDGVNVDVDVGVLVGVGVSVGVFVEVAVGIEVLVDVAVDVGVKVGPNNFPGLHPVNIKLIMMRQITPVSLFMIAIPPFIVSWFSCNDFARILLLEYDFNHLCILF